MSSFTNYLSLSRLQINAQAITIALYAAVLMIFLIGLQAYYPVGRDWDITFSQLPEHWRNPFAISTFVTPPWVILMLPHAWLPIAWGNAVNFVLNIVVVSMLIRRYRGGIGALLLTFTSPFVLSMAQTNNVDWIPTLAFLIPPIWGIPLLMIKPQVLGGAALIWWKRSGYSYKLLILPAVLTLVSLAIWGLWPLHNKLPENALWNLSLFPYSVPFGVYLLIRAWRKDDALLATFATPLLAPYFGPYSLVPLMALLASRYPRIAFTAYLLAWGYVFVAVLKMST